MPELILFLYAIITISLVTSISLVTYYFNRTKILREYKQKFEETQSKFEAGLKEMANKDVLMERASQALETYKQRHQELFEESQSLKQSLDFQLDQYNKLLGQKKSSEVRTGMITEQIAPFLKDYPLDPSNARFLGEPIDIVSFGSDKITFVEIKSGKSQLSKRQREIRDMIKNGKVDFIVYRVEGNNGSDPS